jgi:hypothetical protein
LSLIVVARGVGAKSVAVEGGNRRQSEIKEKGSHMWSRERQDKRNKRHAKKSERKGSHTLPVLHEASRVYFIVHTRSYVQVDISTESNVSEEAENKMKTRKLEANSASDKTHAAARMSTMSAKRKVILNNVVT